MMTITMMDIEPKPNHDFVDELSVGGLFGYVDHDITFNERITILTGPNGSGKTQVLNLLKALVGFDLASLTKIPLDSARLQYRSGKSIVIERAGPSTFRLQGSAPRRPMGELLVRVAPDAIEEAVPPYIKRIDADVWVDERDGELMTTDRVMTIFGRRLELDPKRNPVEVLGSSSVPLTEWESLFRSSSGPTAIETRRLDTQLPSPDYVRSGRLRRRVTYGRIQQYIEQVSEQILDARRDSLLVSERADRAFAARALDRARETVRVGELREKYDALVALNQELNHNGLVEASVGVQFPGGSPNPTERRILSVFLEDWSDKLEALQTVNQKLRILRAIVGDKLLGKELVVDQGRLTFNNIATGHPIPVENLSSGEQHLLALFTMLIFSSQAGDLVLIDEPEISLHAAWKHAFVGDLLNVSELNDFQVVIATHSSAIVHGNWQLVKELTLPTPPPSHRDHDSPGQDLEVEVS